jgi:serine phosphatase RsbU (regulator of sigma subunit)/putative methionine-R-sulfoxide reductase with GAF domain
MEALYKEMGYQEFMKLFSGLSWKVGQSLQDWTSNFLAHMVEMTGSLQGAFYTADNEQEVLVLTASCAVPSPGVLDQKIEFGDGLIGRVAKQKKLLHLKNDQIPKYFISNSSFEQIHPKSLIFFPLVFNEITYAVIEFSSLQNYDNQSIEFVESIIKTLGMQLILLISELKQNNLIQDLNLKNDEIHKRNVQIKENSERLKKQSEELKIQHKRAKKAYDNLKILSSFGQKVTASLDLNIINSLIYDYVSSLMDTSAFGIGIYNKKREVIDFPYFTQNGKPLHHFYKKITNTNSLSVKCFNKKEEILINNLSSEYKRYLKELPEFQASEPPSSLIHVPLIAESRAIGTLTVNSYKRNAYSENDLTNLRTLASYISIALDNSRAYRLLKKQQEQITGSIQYGRTIQHAILPSKELIDTYFDNFILYRPKDIVSGDFYWYTRIEETLPGAGKPNSAHIFAVVDCTGHGVPGAFMSMIGSRLLNEIVNEMHIYQPKKILEYLDKFVIKALRQNETSNTDGMDVALLKISETRNNLFKIVYAGAKRPLYYINDQFNSIAGTSRSIGGQQFNKSIYPFNETTLQLKKGTLLYLSSDGLVDQCNSAKRKFGTNRLRQILIEIASQDVKSQYKNLSKQLDDYQGNYIQRDDITIMGIKL